MLVPILIGMDFLGPHGVGMVIDFNDGYSWAALSRKDILFWIWSNFSQINLVIQFVCHPALSHRGVMLISTSMLMSWNYIHYHPLTFDMNELHHAVSNQQTPENSTHARRQFFKMCVDRHRELAGLPNAQAGDSMCTLTSPAVTPVNNLCGKFNGVQQNEQVQGGREVGPSRGFVSDAGGGSPRSTIQKCLAMFQESQRLRQRIQLVWQLGALQCARSSSELCSQDVSTSHPSADDGPNGGAEGHGHASDRLEGQTATLRVVQESHREGRGGHAVQLHAPRDFIKDEHDVPASFDGISPSSQGIHATTSGGRCAELAPCGDTTCPQRALDMMQAMSAEEQQALAQRMSNMANPNAEQTGDD